jgi:hypothetical protein
MPPFGFSQTQWDQAKEEIRWILIATAQAQEVISYSDLVRHVQTIRLEAHDKRLFEMLGEISIQEAAAGRGMLSVVVVHKHGDMQPGPGFFDLARKLKRNTNDVTRCWVEELKRVHRQWQSPQPTPAEEKKTAKEAEDREQLKDGQRESQEVPVFSAVGRMMSRLWASIFGSQRSAPERLQDLHHLVEQGLISQEDYERKKAEVLKEV